MIGTILLYTQLNISFLIGRKRKVNFCKNYYASINSGMCLKTESHLAYWSRVPERKKKLSMTD